MSTYTCRTCGGRIIFRRSYRLPDGTIKQSKKPIPIHPDGLCTR